MSIRLSYLSLPHNCTFFVAAVASVFPERQKEKTRKDRKVTQYTQTIASQTQGWSYCRYADGEKSRVFLLGFTILSGGLGTVSGCFNKSLMFIASGLLASYKTKRKTDITCLMFHCCTLTSSQTGFVGR